MYVAGSGGNDRSILDCDACLTASRACRRNGAFDVDVAVYRRNGWTAQPAEIDQIHTGIVALSVGGPMQRDIAIASGCDDSITRSASRETNSDIAIACCPVTDLAGNADIPGSGGNYAKIGHSDLTESQGRNLGPRPPGATYTLNLYRSVPGVLDQALVADAEIVRAAGGASRA